LIAFKILFWVSILWVLYVYVGYPVGIYVRSKLHRPGPAPRETASGELPSVTVFIPAHNEERWIRRKIENTLALDYPKGRMEIVVASDGSDDRTAVIAGEFAGRGVRVAAFPTRLGKQEMLNRVVPQATGEIIVATDTNALLAQDALRKLLRHFSNPAVGGATGRRVCVIQKRSAPSEGEGLYWRYESWIKESESRVHSCLGAHGQLYAIRKAVFPHVEKVGEDFYASMKVVTTTGQRIIYEPEAVATIPAAANLSIEFERKMRAQMSLLLTLPLMWDLLIPWRSPIWWQYISHKLGRMFVPPALLLMLVCSAALAPANHFYLAICLAQVVFYLLAAGGAILAKYGWRPKLFYVPFYFTFANAAVGLGWLRWPKRKYDYAWQRTERLTDRS
jgi:cellulose synthase/poly-beta-1,6-N-acetylglucosamine synthase-like glycosyltransferase